MTRVVLRGMVWTGLIIIGLLWHTVTWAANPHLERIGLAVDQTELAINLTATALVFDQSSTEPQNISLTGDQLLVTISGSTIFLNQIPVGTGPLVVTPGNEGFLGWNSRNYRGEFLITAKNGKLSLVNRLPLEDYLRGVVPREVSPGWPAASLKAQAIAARTYSLVSLNRHAAANFDLCATTHCQVYGGVNVEHSNTDQAIAATAGQVLTFKNKLIYAYYHDCSGGFTEDAANIWTVSIPYIKPVLDWDYNAPLAQWTRVINWGDLEGYCARAYPKIGRLNRVQPVAFGRNDRILKVLLKGDYGEVTITGEQFRQLTGLPSSNMQLALVYGPEPFVTLWWVHSRQYPEVITSNDEIPGLSADILNPPWNLPDPWAWLQDKEPLKVVVKGYGWGHGLGMSQWGAKEMASRGFSERQIVEHFYPGASVVSLDELPEYR